MGIVKISEQMHEALRRTSSGLSRSINAQAEHWLRVGMIAELNPNMDYSQICQLLIQLEDNNVAQSPSRSTPTLEVVA